MKNTGVSPFANESVGAGGEAFATTALSTTNAAQVSKGAKIRKSQVIN